MEPISLDEAYPGIQFSPRSRNWWAWLKGTPPECIHIERESAWTATLLPDTLYLRGKKAFRRERVRPEVSLCRDCLADATRGEMTQYSGKIVAFEPDPEEWSQYFFLGTGDFEAAGLTPELATAIEARLLRDFGHCEECGELGTWLWFSREQVASLDESERIAEAPGEVLCSIHGARKLGAAFEGVPEANLLYVNLPYGEAGAYVWI